MSRSSAPERRPPSGDRGQVDPLPALLAVAVVGLALSLYAGVLPDPSDDEAGDESATVALGAVCERLCDGSRVDPGRLERGLAAAPEGQQLRIVLRAEGQEWAVGPTPPETAASAERPVTVRVAPGATVPGRLRVVVWR